MKDKRFDDDEQPSAVPAPGEEDFAALLEQSLGTQKDLKIGQKVEARILQIGPEWTFLDVGQKGEGVLASAELRDAEGNPTAAEGDVLGAYFLSRKEGELRFTTRMGGHGSGTEQLEEAFRSGIPVDGRFEKEIKGGYEVQLAGSVRAFCPFSQAGLRRQDGPEAIIGQSLPFRITQFGERGRNIVVSRRVLLEEERAQQREALRQTLKEGDMVHGTVTSLREFGAFVDTGVLEGLLPISEVAHGRVEKIEDVLRVGQELDLVLKRCDWEAQKFTFSLRDALPDPWVTTASTLKTGSSHTGTVTRLAPFGAFVALADGVEGLVHISKLGEGRRLNHPQEVVKQGQSLAVTIEKIDLEQRRISLVPAGAEVETAETSYADAPASKGMGTFADLMKAAQDKKKRR